MNETDYKLVVSRGDKNNVFVQLYEKSSNRRISEVEIQNQKEISSKLNEFIKISFAHRKDPTGLSLPDIPFIRGH
jgi:hypothetical protein